MGRSARRVRHLYRRQRAGLLGISRLPPGVHCRIRAAGPGCHACGCRRKTADGAHAPDGALQSRHHPARTRARPRLRADPQLLRSGPGRHPVRALRQLSIADGRFRCGRCPRSGAGSGLTMARPLRQQILFVAAALALAVMAALVYASRLTYDEQVAQLEDEALAMSSTVVAYLERNLETADDVAVVGAKHPPGAEPP